MNILGTGLSGLLGTSVVSKLGQSHSFTNLSLETGVDITDTPSLERVFLSSDAPWVFHFAAKTDVDAIEKEKDEAYKSIAWRVNVEATEAISKLCEKTGKRLLYISTDYVFSGTKDRYNEDDMPDPKGFYARTKYEGEKRVLHLNTLGLVIRIANPYSTLESGKKDFVHKIIDKLKKGETMEAPSDQLFIPTFIPDIALSISLLLQCNASGIYHVVGDDVYTPYHAANEIARTIGASETLIKETGFDDFFRGRAPRPFHAVLVNDKIKKLGARMTPFADGLALVISKGDSIT